MKRSPGVRNMPLPRYFVAFLVLAMYPAFSPCVRAQIPGITSSTPAASAAQNATPPDALKRETPRGAILGFIKAAGEERYPVAIQYFQPATNRHRPSMEDEEELAEQLFAIL